MNRIIKAFIIICTFAVVLLTADTMRDFYKKKQKRKESLQEWRFQTMQDKCISIGFNSAIILFSESGQLCDSVINIDLERYLHITDSVKKEFENERLRESDIRDTITTE